MNYEQLGLKIPPTPEELKRWSDELVRDNRPKEIKRRPNFDNFDFPCSTLFRDYDLKR